VYETSDARHLLFNNERRRRPLQDDAARLGRLPGHPRALQADGVPGTCAEMNRRQLSGTMSPRRYLIYPADRAGTNWQRSSMFRMSGDASWRPGVPALRPDVAGST
jgi:hypothetical protein